MEEKNEELYRKIEESASQVEVPDALTPERVKQMLQGRNAQKFRAKRRRKAEIAAACAVLVIAGGGWALQDHSGAPEQSADVQAEEEMGSAQSEADTQQKPETLGVFTLAQSYGEVYDAVAQAQKEEKQVYSMAEDAVSNGAYAGAEESTNGSQKVSYSQTNLQVEGVDESDLVKTDGNYLYTLTEQGVTIVDIRTDTMKTAASINAGAETKAMYLDDGRLYLVTQSWETHMEANAGMGMDAAEQVTTGKTTLLTYDLTDPASPKKVGTVTMDGYYCDSRKTDGVIYLFTEQELTASEDEESVIPSIGGEKISSDCIYMQESGKSALLMASVLTGEPSAVKDRMMLLDSARTLYMGEDAIYLYGSVYENGSMYTDIAKFSYADGLFSGTAAARFKGQIMDTFAISEQDGALSLLLTVTGDTSENVLYLLDENLKETGSLNGIAQGEEVYAARFIGTTAYFITYHNTDPLFAVDISDRTAPKKLGYVEMTGFSDYLHPFGDGLLLGIGYETDPDTGIQKGIKLTMFDCSDPADLAVLQSVVLEGDECRAAYDYRCVFADPDTGDVGFTVETWDDTTQLRYEVYRWDGNDFTEQLSASLAAESSASAQADADFIASAQNVRGLYAGDRFYIVQSNGSRFCVTSYNRKEAYRQLDELKN